MGAVYRKNDSSGRKAGLLTFWLFSAIIISSLGGRLYFNGWLLITFTTDDGQESQGLSTLGRQVQMGELADLIRVATAYRGNDWKKYLEDQGITNSHWMNAPLGSLRVAAPCDTRGKAKNVRIRIDQIVPLAPL